MATRPRVLVVDDELGVRESLRAILGSDHDVVTAACGDEALSMLAHQPVDVVTLDLRMPGMNGIAVLDTIKRRDPEIEVLIVTGYGSLDTAVEGLRHHAFDYLTKPFDAEHVRRVVASALARRAAMKRLRNAPEALLATLSHEFRTPLNVIIGYSTMMGDEEEALSEEHRLALDRIRSNSAALLGYVETLFYLVELDRGLVPVRRTPVPLASLLVGVQRELAATAAEAGVELRIDAAPGLVVDSDEDKLGRIVHALAGNAIRHGGPGVVVLGAHRNGGSSFVLEVRDAGPGLPSAIVDQARKVVDGGGELEPPRHLGFGLRLVGRLVRLLGLDFAVRTGADGTTFALGVPAATAAVAPVDIAVNG